MALEDIDLTGVGTTAHWKPDAVASLYEVV